MSWRRRLRRAITPEAGFFLFLAALALVIAVVYWFVSYETAGTLLLGAFALAAAITGIRLATIGRPDAVGAGAATLAPSGGVAAGEDGTVMPGTDADRPFLDESGRIPSPTYAPFALGVGVSVAATALIFGPAPLLVGLVPIVWGAWGWLAGASAELRATEAEDR